MAREICSGKLFILNTPFTPSLGWSLCRLIPLGHILQGYFVAFLAISKQLSFIGSTDTMLVDTRVETANS